MEECQIARQRWTQTEAALDYGQPPRRGLCGGSGGSGRGRQWQEDCEEDWKLKRVNHTVKLICNFSTDYGSHLSSTFKADFFLLTVSTNMINVPVPVLPPGVHDDDGELPVGADAEGEVAGVGHHGGAIVAAAAVGVGGIHKLNFGEGI